MYVRKLVLGEDDRYAELRGRKDEAAEMKRGKLKSLPRVKSAKRRFRFGRLQSRFAGFRCQAFPSVFPAIAVASS